MKAKDAVHHLMETRPEWAGNIILAGLRGSDAHGTKLDPGHPMATDDVDCLVHDIRKVFALLAKGNPNVLCHLWTEPEDIPHITPAGRLLLEGRDLFLSRRCFDALHGYASGQMAKIHRLEYRGYMGEKRKAIVDKVGYDVKHAAHCVRLLQMGIELAREGVLHTRRPPASAALIMSIKGATVSLEAVREMVQDYRSDFALAEGKSNLPERPDMEAVNLLLLEVISESNRLSPPTLKEDR